MPTTRDYYDILGLPKNASDEQIKQAYRKLARENHPDMVKDLDKASAEAKFKEINEAYQVLSDSPRRKSYDQFGHAGSAGGFGSAGFGGAGGQRGPFTYTYTSGGESPFGDIDPFDVFEQFFGFRGFGGERRARKGKDLHYEMDVSFSDAVHGAEKSVKIDSGMFNFKIPAGVQNGTQMKFNGKGMPGPSGTPSGDLFITFRLQLPKEFQPLGNNLGVLAEIDFVQAVLGDAIDIPIVDTKSPTGLATAKLKIPNGTNSGMQFKLRGKGMPQLHGNGQGDVIVQVLVNIPKKISKGQREILEEYKKG